MKSLNHYTITTGHNRVSPRSEVSAEAIAAVGPLLSAGNHQMPGFGDYVVRVTIEGAVLAATVQRGRKPIATAIVCADEAGFSAALKSTGCIPAVVLTPPALLVDVYATAAGDSALEWVGDFERCLAWAWLERAQ